MHRNPGSLNLHIIKYTYHYQEHDHRIHRLPQAAFTGFNADIRPMLEQTASTPRTTKLTIVSRTLRFRA